MRILNRKAPYDYTIIDRSKPVVCWKRSKAPVLAMETGRAYVKIASGEVF